uniref:HAMP domain-containing protein n=1 Tax=Schistosoma mansoni TaxID=6183 RepID=A0A5K4F9F2_SCHMA
MASALDTNQADVKQNPEEIQDLTASISVMLKNIQESFNTMSEQLLEKNILFLKSFHFELLSNIYLSKLFWFANRFWQYQLFLISI